MNLVLKGAPLSNHDSMTSSLNLDASVIQNVLQNKIIPMARDRVHITLLFSMVTYFVHFCATFNMVELIICYFKSLFVIKDPNFHRKPNLALKHLIARAIILDRLNFWLNMDQIVGFDPSHDLKVYTHNIQRSD